MAIKTRQQLRDYWNAYININGSKSITGGLLNPGGVDIIDSVAMESQISPEYVNIEDITGDTINPQLDWNKRVFRWTNPNNGQIILPETIVEAIPEGWRFAIYNDTDSYSLELIVSGTDVIRSHNNIYHIPATSDADIGKLVAGASNEYYADIEQSFEGGTGFIFNDNVSISPTLVANTWTQVVFNNPVTLDLRNVSVGTTPGSLDIDYPNNLTNGVYVGINIHASIELSQTDQTVDLAFGINGVVAANADSISQTVSNSGNNTTGMFWPYALSFNGFANNGDELSVFIRSSAAVQVNILKVNMGISVDALIGVDIAL